MYREFAAAHPHHPGLLPDAGRIIGALVGLLTATGYGAMTGQPGSNALWIPTLVAGLIGGWVFGRSAWRASGDTDWVHVVFGLGITALFVGALTIGLSVGIVTAGSATTPGQAFGVVTAMTVIFVVAGMSFPGVFALPITIAMAGIWTLLMIAIRGLHLRILADR